jgi:hypothetical protein
MKVEVATVRRLAELSKLSFSENEEKEMVDGLNEMIAVCRQAQRDGHCKCRAPRVYDRRNECLA